MVVFKIHVKPDLKEKFDSKETSYFKEKSILKVKSILNVPKDKSDLYKEVQLNEMSICLSDEDARNSRKLWDTNSGSQDHLKKGCPLNEGPCENIHHQEKICWRLSAKEKCNSKKRKMSVPQDESDLKQKIHWWDFEDCFSKVKSAPRYNCDFSKRSDSKRKIHWQKKETSSF